MTLSEFKEKHLGKQIEYHSYGAGALNQCVDLVNAYINECLDNKTKDYTEIIGTNAKDFKDKFDPEDFDFIANTKEPNVIPERGDIPIWNGRVGGGAGHVALILEANGMNFKSLDQNWSQVEVVTLEEHNYTNVSGWLRPKRILIENEDKYLDEVIKLRQEVFDLETKLGIERDEHILKIDAKDLIIKQQQKQSQELTVQLVSARGGTTEALEELKSLRIEYTAFKRVQDELNEKNALKIGKLEESLRKERKVVTYKDLVIDNLEKLLHRTIKEIGWREFIWAKIRKERNGKPKIETN